MVFVFLQNLLVEITEKPLHVSDNSIGFYKSIHFVFEIGCSFSVWGDTVNFHTGHSVGHSCSFVLVSAHQLHVRSEPHGYLCSALPLETDTLSDIIIE